MEITARNIWIQPAGFHSFAGTDHTSSICRAYSRTNRRAHCRANFHTKCRAHPRTDRSPIIAARIRSDTLAFVETFAVTDCSANPSAHPRSLARTEQAADAAAKRSTVAVSERVAIRGAELCADGKAISTADFAADADPEPGLRCGNLAVFRASV